MEIYGEGVKNIIEKDALRRTSGVDLNDYEDNEWEHFTSSRWNIYRDYFKFGTEIIPGIGGNVFPALCIIPLIIFAIDYKNKKLDSEKLLLYIIMFITSSSWLIIAKGHAQRHYHMNYVLWYFGFIQICFYVIISKILNFNKEK